ncbi:D-alanyl-D-alanine dipeptidase [Geomesophilobacter sediminis]|uniref:D-alanyl-D-alanine dipeptidase n=1 Tax=Geomesophilobacter sediminis TaxID=2798584 RepID=A0A8J7JD80_9BACT|nr:D-alanyl-D-alanine dipeptidase [Geomesophilobacter sediminis]MBJ6725003.1 D-alanyl-D-alanine dipeptidase [Geomesophilobacter sediminis]
MRYFLVLAFLLILGAPTFGATPKANLVELTTVAPRVKIDLRYATPDNFTGKTVYPCGRCFLRPGTAAKIAKAQEYLARQGLSLKMWDCYRPLSVQKIFWTLVPDTRYVADPAKGSSHNRGTAVDVTLVDATGKELEMPTGFDDFSPKAFLAETALPPAALKNRAILLDAMQRAGFKPLSTEWWHYEDPDESHDLLDVPFQDLCR